MSEEDEIRALPLGELLIRRSQLLAATGSRAAPAPVTTYEEALEHTLGLLRLTRGTATRPPPAVWEDAVAPRKPATLDDPDVEDRMRAFIAAGFSDEEIWNNLNMEYSFGDDEL